jgi:hypothetical protein
VGGMREYGSGAQGILEGQDYKGGLTWDICRERTACFSPASQALMLGRKIRQSLFIFQAMESPRGEVFCLKSRTGLEWGPGLRPVPLAFSALHSAYAPRAAFQGVFVCDVIF